MFSRCKLAMALALTALPARDALATDYRVLANSDEAFPGQQFALWLVANTVQNDNVIGYGYLSFATDLTFSGNASIPGTAVGNVAINTNIFNDSLSNSNGHAQGNQYVGVAGVTTDLNAPNPGAYVGDIVRLFDFTITVPLSTAPGTSFIIMPSEGFLQNLTVNPNFDPVSPQTFQPLTITIVPEPANLILIGVMSLLLFGSRHTMNGSKPPGSKTQTALPKDSWRG